MIRLVVTVDDITAILAAGYTVVRVYTDTAEDGTFTTLDGTITLVAGNTGYEYIDTDGTSSTWYKVAYYGSSPGESTKSAARKGSTFAAYATVTELKRRLDVDDDIDDSTLGLMLDGMSRAIDEACRRRFYTTGNDETRRFSANGPTVAYPGDVVSVTTLKTDDNGDRTYERTWSSSDYDLEPYNASLDGRPYTAIHVAPLGSYKFPLTRQGIELVGKFGWPSVPEQIREVTLLATERLWKRKDAILGITGSPELGVLRQVLRDDPELKALLYGMRDRGKLL